MTTQAIKTLVFASLELLPCKPPFPPGSPEMAACKQLYARHLAGYSEARLKAAMDELIRTWTWPRWPLPADIVAICERCDWADHKPLPASRRIEHQEPVEREYSGAERAALAERAEALMAKLSGRGKVFAPPRPTKAQQREVNEMIAREAKTLDLPPIPGRNDGDQAT